MEPNYLKSSELDYEIKIRGFEPTGDVDKRRKVLRGLLNQQKANRSFTDGFVECFSFDEDVKGVNDTLKDLTDKIKSLSGRPDPIEFKRLNSRLTHISGRIRRVKITTDEQTDKINDIQLKVLDLEGELAAHSTSEVAIATGSSTPVATNIPSPGFSFMKTILPYKWNLHFGGDTRKESLISFLEKVEALRVSRNVSEHDLFLSSGDLFTDQAYIWYNNNKSKIKDWKELVQKLKDDFLPFHYEEDLRREIENRTQGANERVSMFISSMEGLFNRLSKKPCEKEIVETIRRNLLPCYLSKLALCDINTISELVVFCKKLEESRQWEARYRPPTQNVLNLLEPDLSCPDYFNKRLDSSYGKSNNFEKNKYSFFPQKNISYKNVSVVNGAQCWNCNKIGHHYRVCRNKKNIFCFACGSQGVTRMSCQRCKSKNQRGSGGTLDAVTTTQRSPGPGSLPSTSETKYKNLQQK